MAGRRLCAPVLAATVGFLLVFLFRPLGESVGRSPYGKDLSELREFQRHGRASAPVRRKSEDPLPALPPVEDALSPTKLPLFPVDRTPVEPNVVVVFAYMRGGSSFLGGIMENNPDVFYWYEPLWDVYNAMTSSTLWQFPLHVVLDENDQLRNITDYERKYIRKSLRSIFSCQIQESSPELFSSWTLGKSPKLASEYMGCLYQQGGLDTAAGTCQKQLHDKCPNRAILSLNSNCHRYMELSRLHSNVNMTGFPPLKDHRECMGTVRKALTDCAYIVERPCRGRHLKVAKILRTNMDVMEDLIREFPSIKIIHQLRDPRGTAVSRKRGARMFHSDITHEARLLCAKMSADIKSRLELEKKYPGVFMTTKYEDLAIAPLSTAQRIYEHIGSPLPETVRTWISETTNAQQDGTGFQLNRKNATATALAWKSRLTPEQKLSIDQACKDVYSMAGYLV